jgi:trans-aconitate 2-methyltransferase
MSSSDWDAATYDRLSKPQQVWGEAIVDRLRLAGHETVFDVGCGTGRLTDALLARLPRGHVVAIDRSPGMLQVAVTNLRPAFAGRVAFVRAHAAALPFRDAADAVFSTATFHWVMDHPALFASVFAALKPGGRLVAQCGGGPNLARLLERAASLAATEHFGRHLAGWVDPWYFADASVTAVRLKAAGFLDVETGTHPAPVTFASAQEYQDFLACVCVREYCVRLPAPERASFLETLTALAEEDDPPFTLDYWRLDLAGRKDR